MNEEKFKNKYNEIPEGSKKFCTFSNEKYCSTINIFSGF